MQYEVVKAWSDNVNAAYNRHDLEGLAALVAPDYVVHSSTIPGGVLNREGLLAQWQGMWAAFPDMHNELQETLIDGDKVAVRVLMTGTHQGTFLGVPPTGKRIRVALIDIIRYENGQCKEEWHEYDQLGFLQQLGLIPATMAA